MAAVRYRLVFTWPDQSRETVGAGFTSVELARKFAASMMAPVGHLWPEWVEIFPGVLSVGREAEWQDVGDVVDEGPLTSTGKVDWQITSVKRRRFPVESGGIDPTYGDALTLFDDLGVAS